MEIFAEMPVWGQSGWEVFSRGVLIALDKIGVRVALKPKDSWNLQKCILDDEDLSRLNRMCSTRVHPSSMQITHQFPSWEYVNSDGFKATNFHVCYSIFETSLCPTTWSPTLSKMEEVWVLSEFNRIGWEKSGLKNVNVSPVGIDSELFNPSAEPIRVKNAKGFKFITNGDFTERKGFELLIEAFVKEFSGDDDVCLIFKSHYGGFTRAHKIALLETIKRMVRYWKKQNPPKVLLFGEKLPSHVMPSFYTGGDCFVLPTKGEGLGIPYMEALACEIPVIATNWGAQLQFLDQDNAYLVKCNTRVVDDISYIKKCPDALNHEWAICDIDHLRQTMRFVYEFRDEAKKKAMQGRSDMEKLTWQNVALWIVKQMIDMPSRISGRKAEVTD